MSDTQAAMREFRFLDDKRKTNGLTPTEEQRWQELAATLGMDTSFPEQPAGYYGEDGQWYAYPEGYDPNAAAWGYDAYGYPQQPQGYYGPDGQWYPYPAPAPYDPNAAYGYPPGYGYPPAGGYAPPGYDPAQWAAWQAQQQQAYPQQGEWPAPAPAEGGAWGPPADPSGGWTASAPGQGLPPAPPPSAPGPALGLPGLPMPAPSSPRAPALGMPGLPPPSAPSAPARGLPGLPMPAPSAPRAAPPPAPAAPAAAPWQSEPEPARGPSLSPFGPPIMGGSLRAKLAGTAAPPVPAPPKPEPLPAPPAPVRSSDSMPELRGDDVMEISDEEVLDIPVTAPPVPKKPAAEAPRPLAAPASEDPVADLRSALSMDDELDFSADLSPEPSPPVPAPVQPARPAPPPVAAPPAVAPLAPAAPPVLADVNLPPALGLEDDVAPTDVALPSASGKRPPAAVAEALTDEFTLDVPLVDATAPGFSSSSSGITQIEAAAATALSGEAHEEVGPPIALLEVPLIDVPPTQTEVAAISPPAVEATLAAVAAEPFAPAEAALPVDVGVELEASATPPEPLPAVAAGPIAPLETKTIPELPSVAVQLPELEAETALEPIADVTLEPIAAKLEVAADARPTIEVPTSPVATITPLEVPVDTGWSEAVTNPAAELARLPEPHAGDAAGVTAAPASVSAEVTTEPSWDVEVPTHEAPLAPAAGVSVEAAQEASAAQAPSPSVEVTTEPEWTAASPAAEPSRSGPPALNPSVEVAVEPAWDAAASAPSASASEPSPNAAAPAASPSIEVAVDATWDAPSAAAASPSVGAAPEPAWSASAASAPSPSVEVAAAQAPSPSVEVAHEPAWDAAAQAPSPSVEVAHEPAWDVPAAQAPSPSIAVAPEPAWDAAALAPSPSVEVAPEPAWDTAAQAPSPSIEVAPEPAWDVPAAQAPSPSIEVAPEPAWDVPAAQAPERAPVALTPATASPAEESLPEAILEPVLEDVAVVTASVEVEPEPPSALAGLALAPETAPLPAQAAGDKAALFGSAWNEAPEPAPASRDTSAFGGSWSAEPEPDLPVASPEAPVVIASAPKPAAPKGDVIFASNWDDVPEVGGPAPRAAAPVPDEWSTAPADKVELASTSDFVSWEQAPVVGAEESLAAPQDAFVVESSSAAELANDFHPSGASAVAEEKLELADNADFLQHQQLTQTGEAWSSDGRGIDVEPMIEAEVELEGEIIQGMVVEEDAPAEPTDSWGAAVSQPSPAPAPPPMRVPPLATPAPPAPIVAAPPPRPAPAPAPAPVVPSLSAAPALQVRVATPIAAPPHAEIHPPPQHPPLESAVPPSGPVAMLRDPFDRSGAPLSGESSAVMVTGEHRVILHTLEGQVKRGAVRDADLCGPTVVLELPTGDRETIARERVKALFFMLTPGGRPPAAEGTKVRVTFKDGRQVAGYSKDHQSAQAGFFVVPADNRTNTERIFIYRHGLQSVIPE